MLFEWAEAKSERNSRERGLPFDMATELLVGQVVSQAGRRHDYGEERVQAIGSAAGKILLCVYTDRGEFRRIISLRFANRRERNAYRATYPG